MVQLKEILLKRCLPTAGLKTELIKRLQESDPSGGWMHQFEAGEMSNTTEMEGIDETQEVAGTSREVNQNVAVNQNLDINVYLLREMELL